MAGRLEGKVAVNDVVYPGGHPRAGEVLVETGQVVTKNTAELICTAGLQEIEIVDEVQDPLILNSLSEDNTASHQEALLRIYQRVRPGNPP